MDNLFPLSTSCLYSLMHTLSQSPSLNLGKGMPHTQTSLTLIFICLHCFPPPFAFLRPLILSFWSCPCFTVVHWAMILYPQFLSPPLTPLLFSSLPNMHRITSVLASKCSIRPDTPNNAHPCPASKSSTRRFFGTLTHTTVSTEWLSQPTASEPPHLPTQRWKFVE
jgi:hypothetical protein